VTATALEARAPDFSYRVPYPAPASQVWRLVGDTHAANLAAGLGAYEYRDEPQADGTTRRHFVTTANNLQLIGEEEFSQWEFPRRFEIRRNYSKGPFARSLQRCELHPTDTGCDVEHSFWMDPRGALGKVWRWGFGREVLPAFEAFAREQAESLRVSGAEEAARPTTHAGRPFKPSASLVQRTHDLVARTRRLYDTDVVDKIAHLLLTLPDDAVSRLRPVALARGWDADRQDVVDAFLAATSAGLVTLRWDVICPHCRGDKLNLGGLEAVQSTAFCSACNLDFDVDLSRSLEAVFTPHPQLRDAPESEYCQGGPGVTPHILYQAMLEPGGGWQPTLELEPGRYRVRVTGSDEYRWLVAGEESAPEPLVIGDDGLRGDDPRVVAGKATLWPIRNESSRRALLVVESTAWSDDSLPAAELVASQRFRELFSEDLLIGGVSLSVESVTILFTDLVGSTQMYGDIGDARAFGLVWTHFEILGDIVRDTGGATVKTIGDAIMAAFSRPEDAMKAAVLLHKRVADYCADKGHEYPVALKIGLHEGPCIVVTLNERLDYFGQTVNTAARVQGLSDGGDIVLTPHIAERTDDAAPLRDGGWLSESFAARMKGLDGEQTLLRFSREDVAATQIDMGTVGDDSQNAIDAVDA